MRARSPRRRRAAGFSLIEVLIALAIVGLAVGAAAETFGLGVGGHAAARDATTALAVAESEIDQAGADGQFRAGTRAGTFGDRFAWHIVVSPYADPHPERFADPASPLRLFRIAVTVAWQDGRRERRVALATIRLGRAPP